MKGKRLLIAGVAILAAIAATALSVLLRPSIKTEAVKQQAPLAVTEIVAPARLQAARVVAVGVPIQGRIQSFHVEMGDEVYEGQLLAQVRSATLEGAQEAAALELERAQTRINNIESTIAASRLEASRAIADASRVRADLEKASRFYTRQKMLLDEGATPRLTFEKAERDFRNLEVESKNLDELAKQAEERVDSLQRELDVAKKILQDRSDDAEGVKESVASGDIASPVGGIVVGRRGEPGEEVNPTVNDLFRIATDLSVLEAVAEPAPDEFARVKEGQQAFVAVAESPDELLPGVVKKTEQGRVIIEFKNPNPAIKPGLSAQVRIKLT
jgi:multidrug efflux pump subunit AcrA (membrane-fusion protein)